METCRVIVESIKVIENGDGGSGEWRLRIKVGGQLRLWIRDGVEDNTFYQLNMIFPAQISDCSTRVSLTAWGIEEDGTGFGWMFDPDDWIGIGFVFLDPGFSGPYYVTGLGDASYTLTVRIDCPNCDERLHRSTRPDTDSLMRAPFDHAVHSLSEDRSIGRQHDIPQGPSSPNQMGRSSGRTIVISRKDFLAKVKTNLLPRLNRPSAMHVLLENPTDEVLMQLGIERATKEGWRLTTANGNELVFQDTPFGSFRREHMDEVRADLPTPLTN